MIYCFEIERVNPHGYYYMSCLENVGSEVPNTKGRILGPAATAAQQVVVGDRIQRPTSVKAVHFQDFRGSIFQLFSSRIFSVKALSRLADCLQKNCRILCSSHKIYLFFSLTHRHHGFSCSYRCGWLIWYRLGPGSTTRLSRMEGGYCRHESAKRVHFGYLIG
jgi:hypothetical protein